jgi:5-methylcytosine-specific restriction endonuclease McrA
MVKRCYLCKESKPLSNYHKSKTGTYGVQSGCKDCNKKTSTEWNRDNSEMHYSSCKKWSRKNPEKVREKDCMWKKRNPEKIRAQGARKRNWCNEPIPPDFQLSDRCFNCGSTENLTLEHLTPVSKGGSNDLSNLATLCRTCNSSKGSKTIEEFTKYQLNLFFKDDPKILKELGYSVVGPEKWEKVRKG